MTTGERQRIIAVVGPDRCGKTEITTALSRALSVPRFKASSEKKEFLENRSQFNNHMLFSERRQLDLLKQIGFSVVLDRGWPCEFAYSLVTKRKCDFANLVDLDREYAALGADIVVVSRSSYDNISDDDDPSLAGHKLAEIERAYHFFVTNVTKCNYIFLNVDSENLKSQVAEICHKLNLSRKDCESSHAFCTCSFY